jgi:penicillin V acylase-like amidase (Ntn superfamily)
MSTNSFYRNSLAILVAATLVSASQGPTEACTRALYVAKDGTVIVGRSMDWGEDMMSNMWVLPRGMA